MPDASSRTPVLFIHTATEPPLGADTWVHVEIMRALDRRRVEPHLACATGQPGAATPTYAAVRTIVDLDVIPVDFGPELAGRSRFGKALALARSLRAVFSLVRLGLFIRRRHIPIVHTSDRPRDALAAVALAKLSGATSIVHVHVAYRPEWMQWMLRWSLAHADVLVGVSQFVADTLVGGGLPPDRVHVVRNGIAPDAWEPGSGRHRVRAELGVHDEDVVVLTVCRLFPEKGPVELIRAIAELRGDGHRVRLLVVGSDVTDGWFLGVLKGLVDELDVRDIVSFLGRRDDIAAVMAGADIYAMPSFEEPFGLVFAEAMAMRIPVVALASGGAPEVVDAGVSGLLVPPADHVALVAALRRLVADPALRARFGHAGRDRVETHLTVSRMADDMANLYRAVASRQDTSRTRG